MDIATVWAIIIFAGQIVIIATLFINKTKTTNVRPKEANGGQSDAGRLKDLEAQIGELNKKTEEQSNIIDRYQKELSGRPAGAGKNKNEEQEHLRLSRESNKQKIGEILLAYKYITKDILDKALGYQNQYGTSITQYLLASGYIDESRLAQCLCTQFGVPYLPLSSCDVSNEIIQMVPADIAEKYWLIPVEKVGNLLVVVMADPIDTQALKAVEESTGCTVQPFVGMLSQIMEALEFYYKIRIKDKNKVPYLIDTPVYKGPERRNAIRFKTKIDVSFPVEGYYKKAKTKDVSRVGFLLESESVLPINSLVTIQVDLPKKTNSLPIPALVQVMRVNILKNKQFEIGVKLVSISRQDIDTIIKFSLTHIE
jgi:hypothetical protein